MPHTQLKLLTIALSLSSSIFMASASAAPIVQPGAPGDTGRILSAEEAVQITATLASSAAAHCNAQANCALWPCNLSLSLR